jgi:hypothetical protein
MPVGLVRCPGRDGEGCPDGALVRPGRTCRACAKPPALEQPKPKPSRRRGVEALIEQADSEAVQDQRAARRASRRR